MDKIQKQFESYFSDITFYYIFISAICITTMAGRDIKTIFIIIQSIFTLYLISWAYFYQFPNSSMCLNKFTSPCFLIISISSYLYYIPLTVISYHILNLFWTLMFALLTNTMIFIRYCYKFYALEKVKRSIGEEESESSEEVI